MSFAQLAYSVLLEDLDVSNAPSKIKLPVMGYRKFKKYAKKEGFLGNKRAYRKQQYEGYRQQVDKFNQPQGDNNVNNPRSN